MSSRFGSPLASIESDEENSLAVGPPIGARYSRKLSFPLVGSQSVSLQIDSRQTARIAMRGILNHAEELDYSFTHGNRVVFDLSDTLKSMLSKFRCSILDAWYDDVTDESCVKLRIDMLRLSMCARMPREKNAEFGANAAGGAHGVFTVWLFRGAQAAFRNGRSGRYLRDTKLSENARPFSTGTTPRSPHQLALY